jgi:uncharacterized protein DUF6114
MPGVAGAATIPTPRPGEAAPARVPPWPFEVRGRPRDQPSLATLMIEAGGLFIALSGIIAAGEGVYDSALGFGPLSRDIVGLGVGAIFVGLFLVIAGIKLQTSPESCRAIGVIAIVLALVSLFLGGGFLVGFAFAFIGGALALTWTPSPPFYVTPLGWDMCPSCGEVLPAGLLLCPRCNRTTETTPTARSEDDEVTDPVIEAEVFDSVLRRSVSKRGKLPPSTRDGGK